MDLNRFNSIAGIMERKSTSISELVVNQAYAIEDIRKAVTKFGDKVIVDLQDNIYCNLPARVSKDLLKNDEQGLKEFKEKVEVSNMSIRRLQGRWNPVEFIITLPDDNINALEQDEKAQGGVEEAAGGSK